MKVWGCAEAINWSKNSGDNGLSGMVTPFVNAAIAIEFSNAWARVWGFAGCKRAFAT